MITARYLIVGGGVAGTTAAEVIRKLDPEGGIIIVSEEPYRFYSRVMLSKPQFFLGQIAFDRIWLKTEEWYLENMITLLKGRIVVRLDPEENSVLLDDGAKIRFDKLLVATGTCSRKWGVIGAQKRGVHYLRTLDDAIGVMNAVKTAKRAVIIGGGFVSFEMCEMLRLAGLEVEVIIRERYFWEPLLDETSGRMVERALEKSGIKITRDTVIDHVVGDDTVEGVAFKDGSRTTCDMIIAGIGVFCTADWVQQGGVEIGRGGVLANEYLETSRHDVWACGDAVEYQDVVLGERTQIATWFNAQMQGRTAATNMTGKRKVFRMVSTMTAHAFGIDVSFVGSPMLLPGRQAVYRGDAAGDSFAKLVLKGKELIGATLINRSAEIGPLVHLIEKDVDVSGKLDKLADPSFDLESIVKP